MSSHTTTELVYLCCEQPLTAPPNKVKKPFSFSPQHCKIILTKNKLPAGQWNWSACPPRYISYATLTYRAGRYVFYSLRDGWVLICKKEKAFVGTVVHVISLFRKTAARGASFSCVGTSCTRALFRVGSPNVSVCRARHFDKHYRSCLELLLGNPGNKQRGFGI